jgi:type I restriction enzyme S subunit
MKLKFDVTAQEYTIIQTILNSHLSSVCKVWVFGSRAKNTSRFNSDLDLALDCGSKISAKTIAILKDEFNESKLAFSIDLVDIHRVEAYFKQIIDKQKVTFPLKRNVPELRFSEFASTGSAQVLGEWEEKKLSDFSYSHKGGASLRPSDFVNSSNYEVIPKKAIIAGGVLNLDKKSPTYSSQEFFEKSKTSQVDNSYLITTLRDLVPTAPSIGLIVCNPHEKKLLLAQGVHAFKLNEELFPEFLVNLSNKESYRRLMYRLSVGSTQVHLRSTEFFKIKLFVPSLPEQQKIATFLSAVDKKLGHLRRKHELLESYKRGVMQKIFAPIDSAQGKPLRFKQDNSTDFPDWEEKRLGDVITQMQSGLSRLLKDEDIGLPVIRSNNLVNGRLDTTDIKYWYKEDPQGAKTQNYLLEKGDLLVNFINSLAQIGKMALYNNELDRDVIITTNIMRLKFKDSVVPNYIFYFFNTRNYKSHIHSITKPAVNQASFTTKDFCKLNVPIPSLEEQQKIANFLSTLDKKLEAVQKQIDQTEIFKKGLLQKMFV